MFDITYIKYVSDKILRAALFTDKKQAINNWHVRLFAVCRNFRHKTREKMRHKNKYNTLFIFADYRNFVDKKQKIIGIFFPLLCVSTVFISLFTVIIIVIFVSVIVVVLVCCLAMCFPSLLFVFASYNNQENTPHIYCYKPVTN